MRINPDKDEQLAILKKLVLDMPKKYYNKKIEEKVNHGFFFYQRLPHDKMKEMMNEEEVKELDTGCYGSLMKRI